jgi:hypothetical protein
MVLLTVNDEIIAYLSTLLLDDIALCCSQRNPLQEVCFLCSNTCLSPILSQLSDTAALQIPGFLRHQLSDLANTHIEIL